MLLLCGTVILLTQFCNTPNSDTTSSTYLNHHDSAHYVGMSTCAECHIDKAQTFVHTGMGLSFDTVSRAKSSANLVEHHVLYDSFLNFYYYPFWRGENLFVLEFRLNGKDTTYKREEEITFIIGSGQHTNSHLIQKGDYVVQAPFTWYAQKGKLDFPPGFEKGNNSRFSRVIDEECMSCHNGLPKMKPGSHRAFASIPNGIDCERCHGPGSIHVARRKLGLEPDGDIDFSIVNPAKLTWERQIDVCQRCHLQGNNVLKPGKAFSDFRPGMVLADVFEVYLPQYQNGERLFNMANHSDRLQSSACFLKSNTSSQQLTCITCHNPHVSVKQTQTAQFNAVCSSCHSTGEVCKESKKVRALKSNNCVECHMPVSSTEDIPHVTVHDHKIGIYKDGMEQNNPSGKVIGLYSVNNKNPDHRTLIQAYLTYYEKFDQLPIYQQKAQALLDEKDYPILQIHLLYQQQAWKAITEYLKQHTPENPDAVTCYRIGKAFSHTKDVKNAVDWLQLAVVKDDSYFEYKSELGSNLIKMNRLAEAEDVLLSGVNQFGEYAPGLNNLGFLYIQTRQYAKAKKYLEESLRLDPNNMNAKENLVLLYYQLGDIDKEKYWLRSIIKQKPKHSIAIRRLSELL